MPSANALNGITHLHFQDEGRLSKINQILSHIFVKIVIQMATEWTKYHRAFARLSAEKCDDKAVLGETAGKIQHNIDAFQFGEDNRVS